MECYLGAIAACLNIAEQSPICQGASRAHTPTKQLTAAQDPNQHQIEAGLLTAVAAASSGLNRTDQDQEAEHRCQRSQRINKCRHAVAEWAAGKG